MNRGRGQFYPARGGRGPGRDGGRGRGPGRGGGRTGGYSVDAEFAVQSTRTILNGLRLSAPVQTHEEGQFVRCPDAGGTVGTRIQTRTNFYPIVCRLTTAYHYDVSFQDYDPQTKSVKTRGEEQQERLPSRLAREILLECSQDNKWERLWAFDGKKNLYSPVDLLGKKIMSFVVVLKRGSREKAFMVSIHLVATLAIPDIARYLQRDNVAFPRTAIQVLEVCLKSAIGHQVHTFSSPKSVFFNNPRTNVDIDGELEVKPQISLSGLALNVDIAFAAFIKEQPVLDMIQSFTRIRRIEDLKRLRDRDWSSIARELRGLNIVFTHRDCYKKHKCNGVTRESAQDCRFSLADGQETDVATYWRSKNYGSLNFPWLPCLDVSKGKKINYLPIEVCKIVGGQRKTSLNDQQTRNLLQAAALKPPERNGAIQESLQSSEFDRNSVVQEFKLEINKQPTTTDARVLPQPFLKYTQPSCIDPGTQGSWNLQNVKLFKTENISSWAVVSFARNNIDMERDLSVFLHSLVEMMQSMGLTVPPTLPPVIQAEHLDCATALRSAIRDCKENYEAAPQIVMVLLQHKAPEPYKEIKRIAEGTLGLLTQAFVASNAGIGRQPRGREQYQANLIMKINQKLGGVHCRLAMNLSDMFPAVGRNKKLPYIFFGGDVTHPTTHDPNEQSVGAIVASMDAVLGQFAARPLFLGHRQETMSMEAEIKSLLLQFFVVNRVKPEAIVFYRDGISDGQFEAVSAYEYQEFKKACASLEADYKPTITYIVVKKRHRARFTPTRREHGDRNENVKPGTVIDSGVTTKLQFDYYLNSHAGIQGTNKAAHYHVLIDENGFGSDGVQLMSYWISYLYCRCTRSVSYAPPAYYAHHAALHGKYLLHSATGSPTSFRRTSSQEEKVTLARDLERKMYFV